MSDKGVDWDGHYTTDLESALANRTEHMQSSIIRETLKLMATEGLISLGGGMPAPELLPVRDFQEAAHYVLKHDGLQALQYGVTEGYPPLKQYLV